MTASHAADNDYVSYENKSIPSSFILHTGRDDNPHDLGRLHADVGLSNSSSSIFNDFPIEDLVYSEYRNINTYLHEVHLYRYQRLSHQNTNPLQNKQNLSGADDSNNYSEINRILRLSQMERGLIPDSD